MCRMNMRWSMTVTAQKLRCKYEIIIFLFLFFCYLDTEFMNKADVTLCNEKTNNEK